MGLLIGAVIEVLDPFQGSHGRLRYSSNVSLFGPPLWPLVESLLLVLHSRPNTGCNMTIFSCLLRAVCHSLDPIVAHIDLARLVNCGLPHTRITFGLPLAIVKRSM